MNTASPSHQSAAPGISPSSGTPLWEADNIAAQPPAQEAAQKWERVAFGWCKIATGLLITAPLGKYALPIVALFTSALFVGAHLKGAHESRCILKRPLLIAAFWGLAGAALIWWRVVKSA